MDYTEYSQKRMALKTEIIKLQKRIDNLDEHYAEDVARTLTDRGIVKGTPILLHGQPCFFCNIKRKKDAVVIGVRMELADGTPSALYRHAAITSVDEVVKR